MRISELAGRTGVPTATIKYYLREDLLPPGTRTAATQAIYDRGHEQRLRLIRALAEVGKLSLAAIRQVLAAVDDERTPVHELLGTAHHAVDAGDSRRRADPESIAARGDVDASLDKLGWRVSPSAPARDLLAHALVALRELGMPGSADDLRPYAEAAHALAVHELAVVAEAGPRGEMVERAVLGTVLYEQVLIALRRLAEEGQSARRFEGQSFRPTGGQASTPA